MAELPPAAEMTVPRSGSDGLYLEVEVALDNRIHLKVLVDGQEKFRVAVLDERPDVESDPILLVFRGDDDEPSASLHADPRYD